MSDSEAVQAELLQIYLARQYRRSYRYGLTLLMMGAMMNWIGFAQSYFLPIRYLGVACVIAGTICIGAAMCKWVRAGPLVIQEPRTSEPPSSYAPPPSKPPDYASLAPPTYEEAILLCPSTLLKQSKQVTPSGPDRPATSSASRDYVVNIEDEKNGSSVQSIGGDRTELSSSSSVMNNSVASSARQTAWPVVGARACPEVDGVPDSVIRFEDRFEGQSDTLRDSRAIPENRRNEELPVPEGFKNEVNPVSVCNTE